MTVVAHGLRASTVAADRASSGGAPVGPRPPNTLDSAMGATTGSQLSHAYYDKRHGLFTYYLLAGLQGQADSNKDGAVGLGELFSFVKENVERVSRRTTMEQVPSITPRIENVADIKLIVPSKQGK